MNREDWLQLRRTSIGGSDVATILGFNKYKSPYQLWLDKTGQIEIDASDPSEAAYWGNVFEKTVAEEFMRRTGAKVRNDNHMYFHREYEFLSANVDRQVVGENAILECKTASMFLSDKWEGENIPDQYIFQVQHYLNVLDKAYAYIAVLVGGQKFQWKRIERDQELIDIIQERLIAFWEINVKQNVAPPIDGSQAVTDFLKERYANSEAGKEITLASSFDETISLLNEAKAAKKTVEETISLYENQIKLALGEADAEIGITPTNLIYWKPVITNRLDTKTLQKEQPDIYEQYLNASQSRRLTIKGIK
jgi:putative phage-type endonuclease